MKAKGYSLWLMPRGETYEKFASLIKRLTEEYNAPVFEPHVTLLGEVIQLEEDIIKKTEELALGQKEFPLTLTSVDYQDFYFRALFIKAEITEPLLFLHNRAKDIFNIEDIPSYMPHLSLLYGNFPQHVKEQIVQSFGRDQVAQFTVRSIFLYNTDGEVNRWHRIDEFPFQ